ncbi:ribonuclease H-like domain-containing protein, partial [Tanacetum coccineum]
KAYKLLSLDTGNVFFSRDVKFYETVFPFKMKSSPNDDGRATPVEDGSESPFRHNRADTTSSLYVQTPGIRRYSRETKLHVRLNDYVLKSNVIWKIKYKASCEIESYKARLVAKGFSQKEGFDYDESFSLVVKMVTVRCLVSIVVVNGWSLYLLDVNNAFLYGDIIEDVYMTLPDGYTSESKSKVCKLNKSLYGLKQASRQCNAKLTAALIEHGFEQSKFDYSLYVKHKGDVFIALLVYVDDIVITGNNEVEINNFKKFLSSKFLIKDLGELKYFLGIEVLKIDKGLCVTQRKYCLELLHEYGLLAARPVSIPFPKNSILNHVESKCNTPPKTGQIDKTLFIKRVKGDILLVQVYVDDIIFGSTKKSLCIDFEQIMHKRFQMSSMGELTFFLGLQVKQKEDGIFISQDKYIGEILKKFGFSSIRTASAHIETIKALTKDEDGEDVDVHLYRSMIGSLMYLTSSRPDIMFLVCTCLRFQV